MVKYTISPKLTRDKTTTKSTIIDSSLGVRTRAKTLALQKLQPLNSSTEQPSYLQLRSRRLHKRLNCSPQPKTKPTFVNSSIESFTVGSGSVEIRIEETEEGCFGENDLEFDCRERSARESTPCSSMKGFNAICTPGSSTRSSNLEAYDNSMTRSMPLAREIEEFFAVHEQEQQRRFADKYNFNFVNEDPLEGCYEWVKVESQ